MMLEGRLHLKRPNALLEDWLKEYRSHKPKEYSFYMRGDIEHIKREVAICCSKSKSEYAFSRFSAAWRLAPVVR